MILRDALLGGITVCSLVCLTSCASWKFKPKLNPNPKYYLTIKGHIDKRLRDKVNPRFMQRYAGINPKCATTSGNIFDMSGLKENPAKMFTYRAKPDTKGNYDIKIPIDKYLPGYCHWQAVDIGITLTDEEYHYEYTGLGFMNYSNHESEDKSSKVYNYICPIPVNLNGIDNCYVALLPGKELPTYLRTDRSTTEIVNIHYEENEHAHTH